MLAAVGKILSKQLGINICIVTVLPDKSENFQSYANTVELFQELEKLDLFWNDRFEYMCRTHGICGCNRITVERLTQEEQEEFDKKYPLDSLKY